MKRIFILTAILFLTACGVKTADEMTVRQELQKAGCWYDFTDPSECLVFEEPYWIAYKDGCFGKCKYDTQTGEVTMDVNPMCTGLLVPGECESDADCAERKTDCASRFVCNRGSCEPFYE